MKILITGKNGQLGYELQKTLPTGIESIACDRRELDITSVDNIRLIVSEFCPDVIINAAAYTGVDKAEEEKDLAFQVNAEGVQNIISVIKGKGIKLIHISTDFVFSGKNKISGNVDQLNTLAFNYRNNILYTFGINLKSQILFFFSLIHPSVSCSVYNDIRTKFRNDQSDIINRSNIEFTPVAGNTFNASRKSFL